jgi:hypothetical protein
MTSTRPYKKRNERQVRRKHTGEPCPHYPDTFNTEAAHMAHNESKRNHYERKRAAEPVRSFEADAYPLRLRIQRLLAVIKQRCRDLPNYAGRGIKCLVTFDDLVAVWQRDNAAKMSKPSIDRIDNDGNYEPSNIRFIEFAENIRRGVKVRDQRKAS